MYGVQQSGVEANESRQSAPARGSRAGRHALEGGGARSRSRARHCCASLSLSCLQRASSRWLARRLVCPDERGDRDAMRRMRELAISSNLKIPNHTTLRPGLSSVSKQGTGALKCLTKLQVHTWFTPSKSFGAKQPSLLTSQPNKPSVALRCEKLSQLWSFVWSSALHGRDRLAGMIDDDDLFVRSLATTHRASRVSGIPRLSVHRVRDTALQ